MFRTLLIASAMICAMPALAAERVYPYLLTQGHVGTKQVIAKGISVQVQLPSGPTNWTFRPGQSRNVVLVGQSVFPSPGRIDGTSAIQAFDFKVGAGTEATIVITTRNLAPSLATSVPNGRYKVTLIPR